MDEERGFSLSKKLINKIKKSSYRFVILKQKNHNLKPFPPPPQNTSTSRSRDLWCIHKLIHCQGEIAVNYITTYKMTFQLQTIWLQKCSQRFQMSLVVSNWNDWPLNLGGSYWNWTPFIHVGWVYANTPYWWAEGGKICITGDALIV